MAADRTTGRYIAVEGPIGVGKTALARRLAAEFGSLLLLEQVEENPFLRRFYEEPERYAFQTQLFFLLERYRQQCELGQRDLFGGGTVADYLFAKDSIFAALTLNADEFQLYQRIFQLLDQRLPRPDLRPSPLTASRTTGPRRPSSYGAEEGDGARRRAHEGGGRADHDGDRVRLRLRPPARRGGRRAAPGRRLARHGRAGAHD